MLYCDRCGVPLREDQKYCPSCGKTFEGPAGSAAPVLGRRGRVATHATVLGVIWIVWSVIRLIPSAGMMAFFAGQVPWLHQISHGFFMGPFWMFVGGLLAIVAILGIIGGVGVLSFHPWARALLIVLAIFALFSFPFGTGVGIYTLWVLFPIESGREIDALRRAG